MNSTLETDVHVPDGLPEVPGGWGVREVRLADRTLRLTLPARPDAFLDDPEVHAAHQRDEYMPYWAYLWPASPTMSRAVLAADWPVGTPLLEIGAGIGLVGLAALCRGWQVVFSDYDPAAVELALHNAHVNGFEAAEGLCLDWRRPLPRKFPVILGCDVIYETRNHGPILDLLDAMLAEAGVAWIGDPGRQHAPAFLETAQRRGYRVELLDERLSPLREPQAGRFQLVRLKSRRRARLGSSCRIEKERVINLGL